MASQQNRLDSDIISERNRHRETHMNADCETKAHSPMHGAWMATLLSLGLLIVGNITWFAAFLDRWPMVSIITDSLLGFAIGFPVLCVAHEGLHGLAFSLLNRSTPGFRVQYGIMWSAMMPYAHPIGAMPARAYRIGAIAPGLLLGILPMTYALLARDAYVAGWAILMISAAAGDLMLLIHLRGVPGHVPVEDLEDSIGVKVRWDLVRSTKPDEG